MWACNYAIRDVVGLWWCQLPESADSIVRRSSHARGIMYYTIWVGMREIETENQ